VNKPKIDPWKLKPWWCQPWSILLTGIMIVVSSWQLGHLLWLTIIVTLPILAWWFYFLLIWPKLMNDYYLIQGENNQENQST
jgi:hypothetical protein